MSETDLDKCQTTVSVRLEVVSPWISCAAEKKLHTPDDYTSLVSDMAKIVGDAAARLRSETAYGFGLAVVDAMGRYDRDLSDDIVEGLECIRSAYRRHKSMVRGDFLRILQRELTKELDRREKRRNKA